MNNKRSNTVIPFLFSIAVIIGMFIGYKLHSNMPNSRNITSSVSPNSLQEVLQLVQQRYVDKIDIDSTSTEAINDLLKTLDPHSVYIPVTELMEVNEDMEGQFFGVGIEFNIFNDTVHVLAVVKDGPAQKAGVEIGDKIIRVNDSIATGKKMTSDLFKKWVKGPGGSSVTLQLIRGSKSLQKNLTRGSIPLSSIDASYITNNNIGYLRLNRFSGNTYQEFMDAMQVLKNKGMESLILDLRDNGGGILEEAVDIVDEFIGGDQLIVYTKGNSHPQKEYKAKRRGIFETGKITVLINEGSASASEIIAGALQDLDRATIIGRRSFGKGLVQEQYTLSDGSALRLTTARYYTPLGRSIQKPYDKDHYKYQMEVLSRMHQGEKYINDTSIKNQSTFTTAKGKKLFGGGGITPDKVITINSILFDTTLNQLYEQNTIGNFSYRYYIAHKSEINQFKSISEFDQQFKVDDAIIEQLYAFASANKITISLSSNYAKEFTKIRIKALMARIAFGETGYFYVLNNKEEMFQVAVKSIAQ
jgi:carboxyl-terminal processing protease